MIEESFSEQELQQKLDSFATHLASELLPHLEGLQALKSSIILERQH